MCRGINGKELTLLQIMERLEDKKHSRILAASRVVYSRQEITSARVVLDRLLTIIPNSSILSGARNSTTVHHSKVRG